MSDSAVVSASPDDLVWRELLADLFDDISQSTPQGIILLRVQFGRVENGANLFTQMWTYVSPSSFAVLYDIMDRCPPNTHYYAINPSSQFDTVSAFFVLPRSCVIPTVQAFLQYVNLSDDVHESRSVRTLIFSDPDQNSDTPALVVLPSVHVSLRELLHFATEFNDCNPDMTLLDVHIVYRPFAAIRLPGSCGPRLFDSSPQLLPMQLDAVVYVDRLTMDVRPGHSSSISNDDAQAVARIVRPSRSVTTFIRLARVVRAVINFYPPLVDYLRPVSNNDDDTQTLLVSAAGEDYVRSRHYMDTVSSMSANASQHKRARSGSPERADDPRHAYDLNRKFTQLPQRTLQLSSDFVSRAVPNPPIYDTSASGAIVQSAIESSFQPANQVTSGRATADGVVWLPYSSAGAMIIRTLLMPNTTPTTIAAVPAPLLRSNANATTYNLSVVFNTGIMLPADSSLSNSTIAVSNDPSANFFQGRVVGGFVDVNCNVGGPATSFLTGSVGASLVCDMRGREVLKFDRVTCAGSAIFAKDQEPNVPIATGIRMQIPALPRGQTICQRATSEFRGTALAYSGNLSHPQNLIFISHVATSPLATNYSPGITVVPWGYVPCFTWRGLPTNLATNNASSVVRTVHCFATMAASGCVIQCAVQAFTCPASQWDSPTLEISPNYLLDRRNGIWVGTFILWDIATQENCQITTWMSRNDERDFAPAFLCRMDNVANDCFINVSGNFFTQVLPTGLNQLSQQLKASPQAITRTISDQFDTSLAFTTVTAASTPSVIQAPRTISRNS